MVLARAQFEAIHPFLDGNGRVRRLLITLYLVDRDLLPSPLLYLSAFFDATRTEYYDRLHGVTRRGAWNEWLVSFLTGVARLAEDALGRSARMLGLLEGWRKEAGGGISRAPTQVHELLALNPYITVKGAAATLRVAFTTAQRAIDRLEKRRIPIQVGEGKRNRVLCAEALLNILEEPAKLAP